MIKINLLNPYKEAMKATGGFSSADEEKNKITIDAFKRILVLAIGPLAFYIYEMQTIPPLQAKLNETNQKYDELRQFNDSKQGLAEEIKKYELAQARFNAQMDFINKIDKDKVNEYKLFELLKTSTPDAVWINKLDVIENSILINAESTDSKEIEKFIQRMSNSDFISSLIPTSQTKKKSYEGTDLGTTVYILKAEFIGSGGKL